MKIKPNKSVEELIQEHDESTMHCSVWPHAKRVSTSYKELMNMDKEEVINGIIKYLRKGNGGSHLMMLLFDIVQNINIPYPERFPTGSLNEDVKLWINWYDKYKK